LDEIKQSFRPGTEEDKCLQSLFITDSLNDREGLVTIKGHRTPGTFEWIPNTNQYRDWEASQNGLLWISGPPGKGKTMISIFLSKRLEIDNADDTVIWFFCDNKTASRNSAVNVIRGLMTQLIRKAPSHSFILAPHVESTAR
jgi:Cdc6-like AAA superfamily ATPase